MREANEERQQAGGAERAGKVWGFGLIGTGAIAELHALAIGNLPGGRLLAAAGRSAEKTRAFAEKAGCEAADSAEELLARPEIEIVCVATSSGSHAAIGEQVLRAGKHLIVEKPMAMTTPEAERLMKLAKDRGLTLSVISQRRFEAPYQLAKRIIDEGKLGRLIFIEALTPFYRDQAYYDSAEWRGTIAEDGGALMNQAIHQIDLMLWFGGEAASATGMMATQTHRMEAEDLAVGAVKFKNGALASIVASTSLQPAQPPAVKLYGELGAIWIEGNAVTLWSVPGEEKPQAPSRPSADGAGDPRVVKDENHRKQFADVIEAIEQGREPLIGGRDGYRAVQLVNAVYEASRSGREIALS
ncbi:Predicted dehydrogenase [Paenibacillus sp. UNCCL117]|uniref:Gfo/Idh/MocA family protein n=1 Tax=unclassified Paenibacillus TaxID=185978 RepID=UPI0008801FE2|nr:MULTISPECIES: Gfo/Idh/MocA family oxidoreductase [unclassified Paenibacillus]SDD76588.1 Predicted dehydrogenase [Paenibacillus sp. cl123]SFW52482.1 Predicted dehydrogenase [Paenibacillus sp. UNCCL117]